MGPEGLKPSPRWVKARHAAANTWIPWSSQAILALQTKKARVTGHLACKDNAGKPGCQSRKGRTENVQAD